MKSTGALVVIDVQLGMFDSPLIPPAHGAEQLLARIRDLIERARTSCVPVIYVQHSGDAGHPLEHGSAGWQIHPAIAPAAGDPVVQKDTPDSFHRTTLQQELESRQIKGLTLVGLQTDYCVDTTCRRAFSLGYDVTLVRDGHSTWPTDLLTAEQIIAHHNEVLGSWFATLKQASEIDFEQYILRGEHAG